MEAGHEKFLEQVEEECEDPEFNIDHNPVGDRLGRFDEEFKMWVDYLFEVEFMQRGGCRFENDDLAPVDWKALAIIKDWRESRKGGKTGNEIYMDGQDG